MYGCSKNDFCITHEGNYTSVAVINLQNEASKEVNIKLDCDETCGYEVRGGTIEFKVPTVNSAMQPTNFNVNKSTMEMA